MGYRTWSHPYSSAPPPPSHRCLYRYTEGRVCSLVQDITVNITSCPPVIRLFRNQPGPTLCMLHVASRGNTCASSFVIATRNVISDAILRPKNSRRRHPSTTTSYHSDVPTSLTTTCRLAAFVSGGRYNRWKDWFSFVFASASTEGRSMR